MDATSLSKLFEVHHAAMQQVSEEPFCHLETCQTKASNLKHCSRCATANYCSKECQSAHWKIHKKVCSKIAPYKDLSKELRQRLRVCLCNITVGSHLPPIADEYATKYGSNYAEMVYIHGGLEATRNMLDTNLTNLFEDDFSEQSLLKRWQEVSQPLYDFLKQAKLGDIFRTKEYRLYKPAAPQQFRNTPLAERGVIRNGDRVVDVGFVDFGILFDSFHRIQNGGDPVIILGFEAEPFCVAKSLVMMEMIRTSETTARSVVEVWMSSLWSRETHAAFKAATNRVLNSSGLAREVSEILGFWSSVSEITADAATTLQMQSEFRSRDSAFAMKCCSLASEDDRAAYLRYYMTKALYQEEGKMVGSIVMNFSNPEIGVKQAFADGMEAVPPWVFQHWDEDFQETLGLMDRVRHYFELNMERLMRLVRSGTVEFNPMFGLVSASNQAVVHRIKQMKPHVIHWSNVIDYISPEEFHRVAKEMSGDETMHYVHSCNWTTRVFGTDIYDGWIKDKFRLHFYCAGLFITECAHANMHGFVKQGAHHFRSICELSLGRRYVKNYFRYFFERQEVSCGCLNGDTPLKMLSPFARNGSPAFFVFTYADTGITFGMDTYDFRSEEED